MVDRKLLQQKFLGIFVRDVLHHNSRSPISLNILFVNGIGFAFLDGNRSSVSDRPRSPEHLIVAHLVFAGSQIQRKRIWGIICFFCEKSDTATRGKLIRRSSAWVAHFPYFFFGVVVALFVSGRLIDVDILIIIGKENNSLIETCPALSLFPSIIEVFPF